MRRARVALLAGLTASFAPSIAARAADAPPAAGDAPGGPVVTKPPKLVKFVEAVYPKERHDAGITASVLLSIEIGDDGKVGDVEVGQGAAPDFDAAAVAAAKQFVFEPAEIDNQPAPVKITYKYDFTIVETLVKTGPQINFDGVVLERFKKKPMPRVTVAIKDLGPDVKGVTGEDGRFAFTDVPPGKHKIELSNPKLVTVSTEEDIVLGKRRTVKYLVEEREEGVDEEVVVRAPRIKKEAVETRIRTEEARRVPGTQGDTLKVVQNLPGVGRSAFGSGQLIVWGSAPNETVVNVDGVEIPALYHGGGLRSTINADLVRSIDLSPGSYGAEYGRGLGGLVKIELASLPKEGVHGYVAADVIDTSAMVSAAVSPHLRLALAGRVSYLDRVLQGVTSEDVGDFVPIPRYDDYQARAQLLLRRDEELAVTFLGSDDRLRRSIPDPDPEQNRAENSDTTYKRLIVRYARLLADGSSVAVTPSVGYDTNSSDLVFGDGPSAQHIGVNVDTWQIGLRGTYRRKLAESTTLSFGLDMEARARARRAAWAPPRCPRARATSSCSGSGRPTRRPSISGTSSPSTRRPSRRPRSASERRLTLVPEPSLRAHAHRRLSLPPAQRHRGRPRVRALRPARQPDPGRAAVGPEPAPRRGLPRDEAARANGGRRHLLAAARRPGHEPRVR